MANLKGGTFSKQAKDGFHRLERFGKGRHGHDDHATHSVALAAKREGYLRDFAQHLEARSFDGKMNEHMGNPEIMRDFFSRRLDGLSAKTATNYVAGWSSMIRGLREANVTIADAADTAIAAMRDHAKEIERAPIRTHRAIDHAEQVIDKMYATRYETGVLAQLQHELGLRTSEARELAKNPGQYIRDGSVVGLVGKGNHEYAPKPISLELVSRLEKIEKLPSEAVYREALKDATGDAAAIPHDFRVTYAKEQLEARLEEGIGYRDALREVSELLNHHREDMTSYYLARA